MVIGVCISSRPGNGPKITGRRVTCWRVVRVVVGVGVDVHTVDDIDPDECLNALILLAVERTHAGPQSSWLNDVASQNMKSMLVTLDTFHFDMSLLNDVA